VGCGSCLLVCPNAGLVYDEREERMVKCNLCPEEAVPPCVRACRSKALDYIEPNLFARNRKKRFVTEWRRLREGV
jgi:carbon-monoxide dehydrogenase iron sulfur subunit